MDVRSILAATGNRVAVIGTEATVSKALAEFALHNIGAQVVTNDGDHIEGMNRPGFHAGSGVARVRRVTLTRGSGASDRMPWVNVGTLDPGAVAARVRE